MVEKEKFDVEKKAVTVTDRFRTVEKLLMCENLQDFLLQGNGSQPRLLLKIEIYLSNLRNILKKIPNGKFPPSELDLHLIFPEFSQTGLQFF